MRIFVNYIHYFRILDIFQVIKGLIIVLFRKVMDNNHFKVVFLIGKVYKVLNPTMGLHDQIN